MSESASASATPTAETPKKRPTAYVAVIDHFPN